MPLSKRVSFKAVLQRGNRVQVPRLIRWEFKLEPEQVLEVTVMVEYGLMSSVSESFYARMSRDGRISVPLLVLDLLQKKCEFEEGLVGRVVEVIIRPAQEKSNSAKRE